MGVQYDLEDSALAYCWINLRTLPVHLLRKSEMVVLELYRRR